jgi:S-DNA-T family DNA segregation ATPase FtsK/SpoIIIE
MPIRGNQIKANSFREEKGKTTTSSKSKVVENNKKEIFPKINFNNDRLVKIFGLFLLLLAVYFTVAFSSYLFTWEEDQSYVIDVNGGWSNLFKTSTELKSNGVLNPDIQNWAGKLGALLSHQFIYEWFGIASFIFIFIFTVLGYRFLFKVKLFSISKPWGIAFSF